MAQLYFMRQDMLDRYEQYVLKDSSTPEECQLKCDILGIQKLELDEIKKISEVGDFILSRYKDHLVPFQILEKREDGRLVLQSFYLLDHHIFDKETNVWRDCELRRYLNSPEFAANFDQDFLDHVVEEDVHTEDYVTKDKFWILSHEEIGFKDTANWFRKNIGTHAYYKT